MEIEAIPFPVHLILQQYGERNILGYPIYRASNVVRRTFVAKHYVPIACDHEEQITHV